MDLNKKLDDLFQSFLTNQHTGSKHKLKCKKSVNTDILYNKENKQLKNTQNDHGKTIKNVTNKSSNSTKALSKSKRIVQFSFDCPDCGKNYKTQNGFKNHKCPVTIRTNVVKNVITTRQKSQELKQNDSKNREQINPSVSNENNSETDKNHLECEVVDEVLFQCNNCAEQFKHRRAFLHHTKNQQCKKTSDFSLQSLLCDIYEDTLNR